MGLDFWIWGRDLRVRGVGGRSGGRLISANEPVEDQFAADPGAGQVDRFWWTGLGLRGGELAEGSVWSRAIEMHQVDGDGPTQVPLVDDQHVVQQFPAQCADHSLADRVRSRCLWRSSQYADALRGEHRVEGFGEPGVPVTYQELNGADAMSEVHDEIAGGLHGPGAGRVRGVPDEVHTARAVTTINA